MNDAIVEPARCAAGSSPDNASKRYGWSEFDVGALLTASDNLRRNLLVKDPLPGFLQPAHIGNVFRRLAATKWPLSHIRAYTRGGANYGAIAGILDHPPPETDDWDWLSPFGDDFCFVVNHIEVFDEAMVNCFAPLAAALIAALGMPSGGFEIACFAGRYPYTPFGIHRDKGSWSHLQYHLGPSPKTLWTWTPEAYRAVKGDYSPSYEPDRLIASGTAHLLEPGDVFAMNPEDFHIGRSEGISTTVSLRASEQGQDDFIREALAAMKSHHAVERVRLSPRAIESADGLAHGSSEFARYANLSQRAFVDFACRCRLEALASNLGFAHVPDKREGKVFVDRQRLRAVHPYRLSMTALGEENWVFCRGYRLALTINPQLEAALQRLNADDGVTVERLIVSLAPTWTPEETRVFLSLLYSHRGIEEA